MSKVLKKHEADQKTKTAVINQTLFVMFMMVVLTVAFAVAPAKSKALLKDLMAKLTAWMKQLYVVSAGVHKDMKDHQAEQDNLAAERRAKLDKELAEEEEARIAAVKAKLDKDNA